MTDAKVSLAGGRILARRCQAKCKATQQQCRCPAVRGYRVCRVHGARGGPRTAKGLERCAAAKRIHGKETRAVRAKAAQSARRVRAARLAIGLLDGGQEGQLTRDTIADLIREMIDD